MAGILLLEVGGSFDRPPAAAVPSVLVSATQPPPVTTAVATVAGTASPDPRAPIALGYRIQIPRLGIDLPIAEGDVVRDIQQQKTPESFAFHLPGTAIPGQGSNTYLYAHARTGMFLALWNSRPGDEVLISTPDLKVLRYVIVEVRPRVPFDDVSVIQPTSREQLTLQTSTGPNSGDPRFVAVAIPAN